MTTIDLFNAGPRDFRALMDETSDPAVLRILAKLEDAAMAGDELDRVEAIGELSDLLVLRQGVGL